MVLPPLPVVLLDFAFDLTTFSFLSALLLFSLFSLALIFHFRLKTRNYRHLKDFNYFWSVRILLVSIIFLWGINELLRIPFLRRCSLFPYFPSLTLTQQANLCKIHIVLSLGLFEPAFLVTLLFLVNVSIKKRSPDNTWAIAFVSSSCFPIFLLQVFFVFFAPEGRLPELFQRTFMVVEEDAAGGGGETVLCVYPLLSTFVFAAFGIGFVLCFFLSCWKVVSLVINKGLRVRIYVLVFALLISLPTQILSLLFSTFWNPDEPPYQGLALVGFISVLSCAAVGQGILVIRPIADALAVARANCR